MSLAWSTVKSLAIPEGDVAKVEIGGVEVWKKAAASYIADGLVAWWDGIWNNGKDQHSSSITSWKDLAGSNNLGINKAGITVGADRVSLRSSATVDQSLSGITIRTVEVVCAGYGTGSGTEPAIYSNGAWKLQYNINSKRAGWGVAGQYNPTFWSGPGYHGTAFYVGLTCDGATRREYFAGTLFKTRSQGGSIPSNNIMLARDSNGRTIDCDILCVRLYSRILSADEIAANYAVDKERFGLP